MRTNQQENPTRRVGRDNDALPPLEVINSRVEPRLRRAATPGSNLADPRHLERRQIRRLPITVDQMDSSSNASKGWNQAVKTVFCGIRQASCSLSSLRNHETTLMRHICSFHELGLQHIKLTVPAPLIGGERIVFTAGRLGENTYRREFQDAATEEDSRAIQHQYPNKTFHENRVAFATCGDVEFPKSNNRNVNMLPFIFGERDSLPEDLQCYYPLIEQCPYMREEIGKVGYLTIHESYVDASKTQRREGLHIESPGVFQDENDPTHFQPGVEHPWGMGVFFGPDRYEGGIYMASSVSQTSQVWDALVNKNAPGMVDKHGGCEYLREWIGPGTKLESGELIWMTDCTPHEALPQQQSGVRQFFRVVTPYVSHWYADHCTVNPKVPLPQHIKVIHGNKFEKKDIR